MNQQENKASGKVAISVILNFNNYILTIFSTKVSTFIHSIKKLWPYKVKILVSQKYFTYLQHFPKKCRTAVNALGPPLTEVPLNGSIM